MLTYLNYNTRKVSFTEIETDKGHDSFLLDEPELDSTISGFLDSNFKKLGINNYAKKQYSKRLATY